MADGVLAHNAVHLSTERCARLGAGKKVVVAGARWVVNAAGDTGGANTAGSNVARVCYGSGAAAEPVDDRVVHASAGRARYWVF